MNVLNGGVGFDVAEDLVGDVCGIENVGYLFGNAELNEVGVRTYKCFLEASCLNLRSDFLNSALAVITGFVEYKSCHFYFLQSINLSVIILLLQHRLP